MAKKKLARSTVAMRSSESHYTYTTQKNKNNTTSRLKRKRYDPTLKRHVEFVEKK